MSLELSSFDRELLAGALGPDAAFAMRLPMRFAEAIGAPHFIDIEAAHVDGCLYLGRASLDFVERMLSLGGRVRVLTLNAGSVDLIHPELEARLRHPAREGLFAKMSRIANRLDAKARKAAPPSRYNGRTWDRTPIIA